ncbi:unnamed protein product [Rhizoctonia solani]|uniref:Uncharacterized protein n=1 Tax=Rhizoctonia solani TaxID=456999 RepID=A0A8H3I1D9_9AGAM|nr:unnamed protein product [Rhizoctonia solani]
MSMNQTILTLPETTPINPELQFEIALRDAITAIEDSESSELNPLLRALRQEIPDEESEFHAWFSSMFKSILQRIDFEKLFDDDVPDPVKDLLTNYARSIAESASDRATKADLISPATKVQSLASAWSQLRYRLLQLVTSTTLARNLEHFPDILEADGQPMDRVKPGTKFQNWGRTVENTPAYTFVARTEIGLCNLVKWAAGARKKVRVAGYRHTIPLVYSSLGVISCPSGVRYLDISKFARTLLGFPKETEAKYGSLDKS